jgi:hypothetical protein
MASYQVAFFTNTLGNVCPGNVGQTQQNLANVLVQFPGLPLQRVDTIAYLAHLRNDFLGWGLTRRFGLPNLAAYIVPLGSQLVSLGDGLPMLSVQFQQLRDRVFLAPVGQGFSNQVWVSAY